MLEYQTFLDGQNMAQFWEFVKWFLFLVAPMVMIWVAIEVIGWLIKIIREATDDKEKNDDDIYYY